MKDVQLIDTHCHVHFHGYDADRREVVLRARDKGVGMVLIGTMLATSKSAIETAEWFGEGLWATVGLHPNYVSGQDYIDTEEMPDAAVAGQRVASADVTEARVIQETFAPGLYLELAKHPRVVGIGETGLDYYHFPEGSDIAEGKRLQKQALREHIKIADAVGKVTVIHCRDAHEDLLALMDEEIAAGRFVKRGILHCFTGTAEQAMAYVARGCMISFSGVVTFPAKKGAPEQQEALWAAVRAVPIEHLLIETDAPYLTPMPNRGKRNEPAFVSYTAEKIAELRGVSFATIAKATTQNARRIFSV